tara:strand:+ start:27701 stop:28444 length:744 start_codon:yes stop_codon:yes gene_type:complete
MYSWKAIRTFCAVLLLIPIIHLTYLASQELLATMDASPEAWAAEVRAYAKADVLIEIPDTSVLVVGGRRVKLWKGLGDLLSPKPVVMRPLGDATINDITHYYAELIGYYQPSTLVVLPGNSEFHVRDNKSAEELVTAIRKLVTLDESFEIPRQYLIFAPIKTPLHPEDYAKIEKATRLLQQWGLENDQVEVLDPNTLLARSNGKPNPDFFRIDGINLNEQGYVRLSLLLQSLLTQDEQEPYASNSTR